MSETLFLSTVTTEFGDFRKRLARFLERTKKVHVRHQDDFFQRGLRTLHLLEEEIIRSQFVVHIIGGEPGWTPPLDQVEDFLGRQPSFTQQFPDVAAVARTDAISATQWEAWLALFLGKRLYGYELPKRLLAGSPQQLHSERLHRRHDHPKAIADEEALFDEVLGSLIERGLLTRAEAERKIAPSRILRHAPKILFGREPWLDALDAAWAKPTLNVYTLVAWGGVGKTSLVAHWISKRLAAKGWPGVERYFDWSFYSQGTGESRQSSSDLFIQEALKFFDDPDPIKGSPWERGERLAGLIRRHRTLLVLDGIEPLQYPLNDAQAGRLKDQALEALLQGLAADNPGLCLVTTREHLKNIDNLATTEEQKLDTLERDAAISLLRHLQVVGTEEEMEKAWKDAGGHALTLQMLGRLLVRAYGKDIRKWREVGFKKADQLNQGRSTFRVMKKYEEWLASAGPERQLELAILRLTGLFDRPISPDCFAVLCSAPAIARLTKDLVHADPVDINAALDTLIENDLLSHGGTDQGVSVAQHKDLPIDAHPLIRQYFADQLRKTRPRGFQAAQSRLFDHLCASTPHWPDTLDGLQPLYQAVVHGCLAGRQEEACYKIYIERIQRGAEAYSTKKLGAMGADLAAVAAFFDEPWSRFSPNLSEDHQAWLLNDAGFSLRALGRLTESLQASRAALKMRVHQKGWENAATVGRNVSDSELVLGRLADAVADARQSIIYADQSGNPSRQIPSRCTAADAWHQSGQRAEAGALFAEAERMWASNYREFPILLSLFGFQFCDWLLAFHERQAWHTLLRGIRIPPVVNADDQDGRATNLAEIARRGEASLSWATGKNFLHDIALDHLTLARVGLFRTILAHPVPQTALDLPHVAAAVNGLRRAGTEHELPKGLLTAALYHFVRGDAASAHAYLDQTQELAKRGPMPLYLADVHLHRARLFRDKAELAKAAKLIRDLGYGRRYDELADAEAVAAQWPTACA